jgi:4-hydroxybenzoate polyprenyltransferase
LTGGLTLQNWALAGLAGIALSYRHFPNASAERPLIPLEGLLILAIVALAVNIAALAALTKPDAPSIQKSIKTSLLALTWLHVGVIAAVRGWEPAALVALFWPPAFVLGRWLYTT